MTQEQARIECAIRWPGVDPDALEVEFDLNFERAAREAEAQRLEALAGIKHLPREFDLDVDQLLAQAELLCEAARQLDQEQTPPADPEIAAAELETFRRLARGLDRPLAPGRPLVAAGGTGAGEQPPADEPGAGDDGAGPLALPRGPER
jgi:hypothetical protein